MFSLFTEQQYGSTEAEGFFELLQLILPNHLLHTSIIVLINEWCVGFKRGFSTQVINDSD